MTTMTSARSPRQLLSTLFFGVAVVLLAFGTLTVFSAPAGAAASCGTYSFGFEGTRLLNDGISNSAGPFAVNIPAGTYTVTLVSHDHHSRQVNVVAQSGEQYHAVLDSGYVSPPSRDVPESADNMTTVFPGQVISQSNAISVKHAGAPGINSVDVVCIGFTPETPAQPTDDDTVVDDTVVDDTVVDDTVVDDTVVDDTVVDDTVVDDTVVDDTVVDDTVVDDTVVDDTVVDDTVVEPPVVDDTVAKSPVDPDQDISGPVAVETEVKGIVETPVIAQLAITGPSAQALTLIGLAFALMFLGGLLLHQEKRLA